MHQLLPGGLRRLVFEGLACRQAGRQARVWCRRIRACWKVEVRGQEKAAGQQSRQTHHEYACALTLCGACPEGVRAEGQFQYLPGLGIPFLQTALTQALSPYFTE